MTRDPHDPRLAHLPETLRERATKLEYDADAKAIVAMINSQFDQCASDVMDTLARHHLHKEAFEAQLRTALGVSNTQAFQYDHLHALIVDGTPMTGQALEHARGVHLARFKIQVLAHLYVQAQQEMQRALSAFHESFEGCARAAGLDPSTCALLDRHIVHFDPMQAPLAAQGGAKA